MKFHFDIQKSIAASAYLIKKNGGNYNVLFLVKSLYYANRNNFVRYGRSITGDRLISMKSGPNVSETYDLICGSPSALQDDVAEWEKSITRTGNTLRLIATPSFDCLSPRDIQMLDESWVVIKGVKGRLDEWSHNFFPEWQNLKGLSKSKTIEPKIILALEKKSPEEIEDISSEIEAVNWLKSIAR